MGPKNLWGFEEGSALNKALTEWAADPRHNNTDEEADLWIGLVVDFLYSRAAGKHHLRAYTEGGRDHG